MRIKMIISCWLAAALCLMLASCSKQSTLESTTHMVDAFFSAIKTQDFETASAFFIENATRPREEWLNQLREYHEELGELQDYALQSKVINTVYSGARYTLMYRAKFLKRDADINLIVFEGVSSDAAPQIEVMQVHPVGP